MKITAGKKILEPKIELYDSELDKYFVKNILMPYLSQVYYGLIYRGTKDYIGVKKTKQYLNLPELIGQRICEQINSNGDARVEHDEFVGFFLRAMMGSKEQRMHIAFKCYDFDGDECIQQEEIH